MEDRGSYESYSLNLKQIACPFCRSVGHLNRHGFLRGYGKKPDEKVIRGFRVYCSNRGRRQGCGKTHSVLLGEYLHRHGVRSGEVTRFFNGLLQGESIEKSWWSSVGRFCVETGRAIWRKFSRTHLGIRAKLFGKENISSQTEPRRVTWEGIRERFGSGDPVRDYQLYFQRAFFSSG